MSRRASLVLEQLDVIRMPGLSPAFTVPTEPGLNLILGPNESGKSSVARAVRLLLWPDEVAPDPCEVSARFTADGVTLRVTRRGRQLGPWQNAGQTAPAPPLPPAHLSACYRLGLLDLHRATAGLDDNDLAGEIRRQMAGGYALEEVSSGFPDQGHRIKIRHKPFLAAIDALRNRKFEIERLATEETDLAGLRAERSAAEAADARLRQLQTARDCQELDRELNDLRAKLATLPAGTEQTRDDDESQFESLELRVTESRRQEQELRARLASRRAEIDAVAVDGDPTVLAPLLKSAEEAAVAARETAREYEAGAAITASLRRELAPEILASTATPASVDAVRLLLAQHGERSRIEAGVRVQEALLATLNKPADDELPKAAAPPLGDPEPPARRGLVPGVAGCLAGVVLYMMGYLAGAAACAAAGLTIVLNYLAALRRHHDVRRRFEEYGRTVDHPLPAGWGSAEAQELVRTAMSRQGALDGAESTRTSLVEDLETRRNEALAERAEHDATRRALLAEHDQDPTRDTADLAHEWDRLRLWHEAASREARALAARDHDQRLAEETTRAVAASLRELGVETDHTLAGVQAGCQRIAERMSRRTALHDAQTTDEQTLQTVRSQLATARAERGRLLERLRLTDDEESGAELAARVGARVAARPQWSGLTARLNSVADEHQRKAAELEADEAIDLLSVPADELEARRVKAAEDAATLVSLIEKITALETRIGLARSGNKLEAAQAEVDSETDKLAELVAEHRLGIAGKLLLADVAREHEEDTQPPVLKELNGLLATFTRGRYKLLIATDDQEARFVALTETEDRRELSDLSDGTRAQILLAARLAFLKSAEHQWQLPLFLDEALTASDPARFRVIAAALGRLAVEAERQIFYLTSNPGDVGAWRQALDDEGLGTPHLIELGVIRRVSAAANPAELAPPAETGVPSPAGHDASSYARLLEVPRLDPHQDPRTIHPFYLCRNDLALVRRLHAAGAVTLGRWRRLGPALVAAGHFEAREAEHIAARADVYRHFAGLWRIGRGRLLTTEALQESGVISDHFMGPACSLLEETGGDARAFIDRVEKGGLPRFHTKNKIALQDFLKRDHYVDDQDILSAEEIVARILTMPPVDLSVDDVRTFISELLAAAVNPDSRSGESGPTD